MPLPTPGQRASRTRPLTDADVRAFASTTGDDNPVHLDDAYAASTRFGRRVAHGLLTGSLVGALLGTELPGPGTVYLSQAFQFKAPVYVGDVITATVEVVAVRAERGVVTLRTTCTNQDGVLVLDGEAVVLAPPQATAS